MDVGSASVLLLIVTDLDVGGIGSGEITNPADVDGGTE